MSAARKLQKNRKKRKCHFFGGRTYDGQGHWRLAIFVLKIIQIHQPLIYLRVLVRVQSDSYIFIEFSPAWTTLGQR